MQMPTSGDKFGKYITALCLSGVHSPDDSL